MERACHTTHKSNVEYQVNIKFCVFSSFVFCFYLDLFTKKRSILNHFSPKIDAWSAANHLASLTEQQVLDIVRSNYESLTLKLEDDLDQYERYTERPDETNFFTALVVNFSNLFFLK